MNTVRLDIASSICHAYPEAIDYFRISRDPEVVSVFRQINEFERSGDGWNNEVASSTLRAALKGVKANFFLRSSGAVAMVSRDKADKPISVLEVFDLFGAPFISEVLDFGSAKPARKDENV